ncbi:MAG: NAD-dependent succinate-semialdehyde dehydrogenase [Gammaproteobacteria bacterium]|nr:NAD-dependent succinate-semialdehyde dehydrogenase [Gammaproteobacteria bacterium]
MNPLKLTDASLFNTQAYINGTWCDADNAATFSVDNPADGSALAEVANCSEVETHRAIDAANAALPAWRALTPKARASLLAKWHDLILANVDDLAKILTAEQGKPLAEAKGEIIHGAAFVEWFSEECKRVYGDVIAATIPDRRLMVIKQAIGVTAAITPWNFPFAMVTRKVAPALAAGCTIILKPAEQTPLSALAIAALAARAGIPKGVFNVIPGDADAAPIIGGALCASPIIRKLSFTGSTEVGRILMRQCAPTIKKLSLELGGNAPFIVFEDADLDKAAEGLMQSKFRNAGQTCVSANRIYVHANVHDAFAEKVAAKMTMLKVGAGNTIGVNVGPLIDDNAVAKVCEHVADALEKGATLVVGGNSGDSHAHGGRFYQPTLLTNVPVSAMLSRNETFGPVAALIKFNSDAEVINLANDSELGLAAYFYSRDIGRVFKVAEALETGMVGINTGVFSTEVAPFGGVKQSGLGREGSKYGIEEYVEVKYLCLAV